MERICFGVDIGGTGVKLGLFNTEGKLLEKWVFETRKAGGGRIIMQDTADFILTKIKELNLDNNNLVGIGIGLPGPVKDDGEVLELPNLGLGHFNIVEHMEKLTGLKVKAGNDANIAALGEQWQGSGKGYNSLVMVTLGTGVGGGIVVNGEILAGSNGAAGEIGHLPLNPIETDTCGCGKKGCLEQYASATGIVRLARKELSKYDEASALNKAVEASALNKAVEASALREYEEIDAKLIFDLAKEGDKLAIRVVDKACAYLGLALANVAQVVDPEAFIIGGGVSKAGDILIEKVSKHYNNNVMDALKNKHFKLAALGNDAGIFGAARMLIASE